MIQKQFIRIFSIIILSFILNDDQEETVVENLPVTEESGQGAGDSQTQEGSQEETAKEEKGESNPERNDADNNGGKDEPAQDKSENNNNNGGNNETPQDNLENNNNNNGGEINQPSGDGQQNNISPDNSKKNNSQIIILCVGVFAFIIIVFIGRQKKTRSRNEESNIQQDMVVWKVGDV